MQIVGKLLTKGGVMMRSKIARMLVFVLLVGLIPSGFLLQARAEESSSLLIRPEADKFFDGYGAYPNGIPDGGDVENQNALLIGYEDGFGASWGAFRFDLDDVDQSKTIEQAVLSMYIRRVNDGIGIPSLTVYGSHNNAWTDNETTLLSKDKVYNYTGQITPGQRITIDVTDFVKPKITGEQPKVSFLLEGNQTTNGYFIITDSYIDNELYNTYLEVTYALNSPPTDLSLSANTIPENSRASTPIGTFSATDPDAGDTFTYSLVDGDEDFQIIGNELRSKVPFDYEVKSDYSIRVRVADSQGLAFEKDFTITVTNVNETPSITSFQTSDGNAYTNTEVVSLSISISDPDVGDTLKYQLSNTANSWDGNWQSYTTTPTLATWTLADPGQDGPKTVYLLVEDAGGIQTESDLTVTLDKTLPTGTLTINNGASYTTATRVNLNAAGNDANGVASMRFSNNPEAGWDTYQPYSTGSIAWDVSAGDGSKEVWLQLRDNAGNDSEPIRSTITLDTASPTGSITINQGAPRYTNSTQVTLHITAGGDSEDVEVRFSNDGITWSAWQTPPANGERDWTLAGSDGLKTVKMEVRDQAGNTASFDDSITLDTTPPTVSGVIDGQFTSSDVTISFEATATATLNGAPFSSGTAVEDEGSYTLVVTDAAGNTTTVSFTIVKTAPTGSLLINGGDAYTNTKAVTLSINANGSTAGLEMAVYEGSDPVPSYEAYAATKSWLLSDSDGTKTIHVNLKERAGNVTTLSNTITLDTAPPTGSVSINGGALTTSSPNVTLAIAGTDNLGQIEMRLKNENDTSWGYWQSLTNNLVWRLESGNGAKKVLLELKDEAGNTDEFEAAITLRVPAPAPAPPPTPEPPADIPVTDVVLDKNTLSMYPGDTQKLTATVHPDNATNKEVTWISSDPDVAEVNDAGKVTAKSPGKATITVKTRDGGKTDSANVTVRKQADFDLEASNAAYWLKTKESTRLRVYKVEGKRKTDLTKAKDVTYSLDNDLVTIKSGIIKAGNTTGHEVITVRYQGEELRIPVTVSRDSLRSVRIQTGSYAVLEEGEERVLQLIAELGNKDKKEVTEQAIWTSSNLDVVEVNADGKLIAGEAGKATITAQYSNKKTIVRILVLEEKKVKQLVTNPRYVRLSKDDSKEIAVYGDYGNRYQDIIDEEMEWTVEDSEIATVEDGKITAHKKGRTVITVRYQGKEAKIAVIVD